MASVFTNLTLRFILLRILCVSTILLIIQTGVRIRTLIPREVYYYFYVILGILSLVLIHHGASAFGPSFTLPGLLDLLLICMEIGPLLPATKISTWYPREIVFYYALYWTTCIMLGLLAFLRTGEAIHRGWRFLWTRYDITGAKWAHRHAEVENPDTVREPVKPYHVLFGTSLWKMHFLGESKVMVICRGICAALVIVAIPIFALFVLVIEPVYETGMTPLKGMTTLFPPKDFKTSDQPVWNVVVSTTKFWQEGEDNNTDFSLAITVTPLWNSNNNDSHPPCLLVPDQTGRIETLDVVVFHCQPRIPIPKDWQKSFLDTYEPDFRPDLLITVNFTKLNIPSNSILDGARNSVQINLGLTNTTRDVLQRSFPTTLLPGMNVIGTPKLAIRQNFGKATVAALGIIDSYDTFLVSELVAISPDPQASISSLIPRSPEIGTIRIVSPNDISEWNIIQDTREKSVTSGFATIGGLWAFLGGIFTALFGSSIMRILSDSKPISVFGLVRSYKGDNIREAYLQAYPRLIADLKMKPDSRGLVSFISDYLVDFSFLAKGSADSDSDSEAELHDDKAPTNLVRDIAAPLSPLRNVSQAQSPTSYTGVQSEAAVGLGIWGVNQNQGR